MDSKTQKTIEMLKAGKVYTEIQSELSVSPSFISQIRREYAEIIDTARNTSRQNEKIYPQPENNFTTSVNVAKAGNYDSATVIRLKELDCELTLSIKDKDNQEKQQERAFKREKYQTDEENKRLRQAFAETLKKQNEKINELENMIEELREEMEEKESQEDFDPEFDDDISNFVSNYLKRDGERWETEEINEALNEVTNLKERFQAICNNDETNPKEFDEWKILSRLEKSLKDQLEEIKNSWFNFPPRYDYSLEWEKELKSFLEEKTD